MKMIKKSAICIAAMMLLNCCASVKDGRPPLQKCLDENPEWKALEIGAAGATPEFMEQVNAIVRKCEGTK